VILVLELYKVCGDFMRLSYPKENDVLLLNSKTKHLKKEINNNNIIINNNNNNNIIIIRT